MPGGMTRPPTNLPGAKAQIEPVGRCDDPAARRNSVTPVTASSCGRVTSAFMNSRWSSPDSLNRTRAIAMRE